MNDEKKKARQDAVPFTKLCEPSLLFLFVFLAALGGFRRWEHVVNRFITDERLRRVFTFQALYAGLAPRRALLSMPRPNTSLPPGQLPKRRFGSALASRNKAAIFAPRPLLRLRKVAKASAMVRSVSV